MEKINENDKKKEKSENEREEGGENQINQVIRRKIT